MVDTKKVKMTFTVNPVDNFVCSHCGVVFDNETSLANHENKCAEAVSKLRTRKQTMPPPPPQQPKIQPKLQPHPIIEKKRIALENILRTRLEPIAAPPSAVESITAKPSLIVLKPFAMQREMSLLRPPSVVPNSSTVVSELKEKLQKIIQERTRPMVASSVDVTPVAVGQVPTQQRPQRNRIRKNHKDFVYDLPNTSAALALNHLSRMPRRRNTIQDLNIKTVSDERQAVVRERKRAATPPTICVRPFTVKKIRGAALKLAKEMVAASKAKFIDDKKNKLMATIPSKPTVPIPDLFKKEFETNLVPVSSSTSKVEEMKESHTSSNPLEPQQLPPPEEVKVPVIAPDILSREVLTDEEAGIKLEFPTDPDAIERELEELLMVKKEEDDDDVTIIETPSEEMVPSPQTQTQSSTMDDGILSNMMDIDDSPVPEELLNDLQPPVEHQLPSGEEFKNHLLNNRLTEPVKKIIIVQQIESPEETTGVNEQGTHAVTPVADNC